MTTYVTGDIHGDHDIAKLSTKNWPEGAGLRADDRLMICGDFGLVWSDPPEKSDAYWLDWLEDKPWGETLFCDGNHENHDLLDAMPVSEWHGGRVHRLPGHESIIHLMRGEAYEVDGEAWWVFGGALSHDREWRVEGESWWAREAPSEEEMAHGLETLEAIDWAPGYVFTHECPTPLIKETMRFGEFRDSGRSPRGDYLSDYLAGVDGRLDKGGLRKWYFGHWHHDRVMDRKHDLLYQQVVRLGGDPVPPPWPPAGPRMGAARSKRAGKGWR